MCLSTFTLSYKFIVLIFCNRFHREFHYPESFVFIESYPVYYQSLLYIQQYIGGFDITKYGDTISRMKIEYVFFAILIAPILQKTSRLGEVIRL